MCGRTCLTLEPSDLSKACQYKSTEKCEKEDSTNFKVPEYRMEYNCGKKYEPSYNIAPTDVTPVLVSSAHFEDSINDHENLAMDRVLVPMMWGIIPYWHTGDYRRHGLSTNNCRLETMLSSKLYKNAFHKGQRCVVLCEGFYEWQTTNKDLKSSERSAYYIYMPQNEGVEIVQPTSWKCDGELNLNLLKVAGLFDVWTDEAGDNMYSYSVITFESNDSFSWLHHRSPAILETDQQVADWLDFGRVSDKQALDTLRPAKDIVWHKVSNLVNNSRNKSNKCNRPYEQVVNEQKSNLLNKWLGTSSQQRKRSRPSSDDDEKKN